MMLMDKSSDVTIKLKRGNVFKFNSLPFIEGFQPLSSTEFKKDVREIEKYNPGESDSDCSIKSDDILPSNYPVKPRKNPKLSQNKSFVKGFHGIDNENRTVEESLNYCIKVQTTQQSLFKSEKKREYLEHRCESFQSRITLLLKKFNETKRQQEGYYRILQGFVVRALHLYGILNGQKYMLYDVLQYLQRRREAIDELEDHIEKLKTLQENNQDNAINCYCISIRIEKTTKELKIFVGQWLMTPFGEGKIIAIQPEEFKVQIQLGFGVMHAVLSRVVCWLMIDDSLSLIDDEPLFTRWKLLDGTLKSSYSNHCKIQALLQKHFGPSYISASKKASTTAHGEDDETVDDNMEEEASGELEIDIAHVDDIEKKRKMEDENETSLLYGPPPVDENNPSSDDHANENDDVKASKAERIDSGNNLLSDSNSFNKSKSSFSVRFPEELLPLALAPACYLPYTYKQFCHKRQRQLKGDNAITLEVSAFNQNPYVAHPIFDSQGENSLDSLLAKVIKENDGFDDLRDLYLVKINDAQKRCAQLSQNTANLRLNVFTRRVRRRNNLMLLATKPLVSTNSTAENKTGDGLIQRLGHHDFSIAHDVPKAIVRESKQTKGKGSTAENGEKSLKRSLRQHAESESKQSVIHNEDSFSQSDSGVPPMNSPSSMNTLVENKGQKKGNGENKMSAKKAKAMENSDVSDSEHPIDSNPKINISGGIPHKKKPRRQRR